MPEQAFILPEELQFERIDGVAHGRVTALPEKLLRAFRAVGCRLSWRANRPEAISISRQGGHRTVTREMLSRMCSGNEELVKQLSSGLTFDDSGNVVLGDGILMARSQEAHDHDTAGWEALALTSPAFKEAEAKQAEEIDEIIQYLESKGVEWQRNDPSVVAPYNRSPDPLDLVQVNKNISV